jgi:hypothetical protein
MPGEQHELLRFLGTIQLRDEGAISDEEAREMFTGMAAAGNAVVCAWR